MPLVVIATGSSHSVKIYGSYRSPLVPSFCLAAPIQAPGKTPLLLSSVHRSLRQNRSCCALRSCPPHVARFCHCVKTGYCHRSPLSGDSPARTMAVGTLAQQDYDYDIDTPSIYSNDADDDENFLGWPHLVGLDDGDLDFNYSQQTLWKSRRCPPELGHLPDGCPDEIARIVRESVAPDLYFSHTADSNAAAEHLNQQQPPPTDECSTSLGSRSDPNTVASSVGNTPSLSGDSSPSSGDVTDASSTKDSSSIRSFKEEKGLKPYIRERNTFK